MNPALNKAANELRREAAAEASLSVSRASNGTGDEASARMRRHRLRLRRISLASRRGLAQQPLPDKAKIEAGESVYSTYCAPCHGDRLVSTGQFPNLRRLTPRRSREIRQHGARRARSNAPMAGSAVRRADRSDLVLYPVYRGSIGLYVGNACLTTGRVIRCTAGRVGVRSGSFTTGVPSSHFRNAPKTGRKFKPSVSTLCARKRPRHHRKTAHYSMTSSARASSDGGTSRPSNLAVSAFMTNSGAGANGAGGLAAALRPWRTRA